MTVNRTTLLDLPLPVTGTESGTWGDTTNNGLTQYMDIAIAGMSNLTSANFTTGALTIETTEGDSTATNISATSAQYAGFRVTSLAQNSTITVGNTGTSPARSYRLINADATYTLTFKATGQTGITLQPGQTAVVAFNGTDYVIVGMAGAGTVTDNAIVRFDGTTGKLVQNSVVTIADSTGDISGVGQLNATTVDTTNVEVTNIKAKDGTAAATIADSTGVVTVTAAPVMTALTASQAVFTTSGKALTSNAITGTGNVVMSASPTLTGTISAAAATLSGNLTLSGGTANGVLYLDGSKVTTSGSGLTFDGTNFSATRLVASSTDATGSVIQVDTSATVYGQMGGSTSMGWKAGSQHIWNITAGEQMRLTSTGLGIGTSSPGARIDARISTSSTTAVTDVAYFYANSTGTATSSFGARLSLYTENANGNEYPASIAAVNDAGGSGLTNLAFYTYNGSLTERMRLDSSGNLGLGVTPSAWSGRTAIQVGAASSFSYFAGGGTSVGVSANFYFNGSNSIYIANGFSTLYQQTSGEHQWYTAPSGTAGNAITFTQAMTLGSDGLFQVGTTTGAVNDGKLQVSATGTGAGTANTVVGLNVFEETSGNKAGLWFGAMTNSNVGVIGSRTASGSIAFQTYSGSWGERARITSGGDLLVGTTAGVFGSERVSVNAGSARVFVGKTTSDGSEIYSAWSSATSGDNRFAGFWTETSATERGSITYNRAGGLVAYNTTSDYRAKDVTGPVANSGATIDALKVYNGKMKGAAVERPMLVAHEAQAVAPYAVTGEKDAVDDDGNPKYQQIDVSSFVPLLIAEIQSLRQRVAQLEGNQP